MRLAKLNEDLLNKTLAISIKTREGNKLINEGAVLSDRLIDRLINSGLNAVYIEDDNQDMELQETLSESIRIALFAKISETFAGIEKNEFNSVELLRYIRIHLLPEIKNEPVTIPANQVMNKEDYVAHSINVAILAIRTAYNLGMNMEKIEQMAFIALLHDVGKIIKNKDSKLKNIPDSEVAYEFLKQKNCSVLSYIAVRFQDEHYDGSGVYKVPRDKQIDFAKVLSVCNYYENLLRTSNLMPYECFEKTQSLVNIYFDPEVFQAFRDAIYIYPIGLPVCLNNHVEGIIIHQNESFPLRPIVKSDNKYYNLMENLTLFIEKAAI